MAMRTTILAVWTTMGLALSGCGDEGASSRDTTNDLGDAFSDTVATDADSASLDTRAPDGSTTDSVAFDASADANGDADLTEPPADVTTDTMQDGGLVADTAADAADVNGDATDTQGDVAADTSVPQGVNVLSEGSFERWSGGLPLGWVGAATNFAAEAIQEDTSAAHDGLRACILVNPSATHKRLSTAPQALVAGRYTCTYWARGTGEIRNARFDGDYSSYSGYTTVASDVWQPLTYTFNLAANVPAFELVFSVRNTGETRGDLRLDDVSCTRAQQPCDTVTCEGWQLCDDRTATCETAAGFCADGDDCDDWQVCGDEHRCLLAPDACERTTDCGGDTPVCELTTHSCVAGDPCAGVVCREWERCNATNSECEIADGRCTSLAHCDGALPTCEIASHSCVAVDDAANVVPNGGFESWDQYSLGGAATWLLPDAWYGLYDGASAYFPETELAPGNIKPYTTQPHGGVNACQLIDTGSRADRFTTDPFTVMSGGTYECAYWVRGHGTFRQRSYCAAWGPDTEFAAVDSDTWQQVRFDLDASASWCVLVFYASNTAADRDHVQLDDVVCIKR